MTLDPSIIDLFRLHPVSDGLDEQALQAISGSLELQRVAPGEHVHRANEVVRSVYLIVRGRLQVDFLDNSGRTIYEREILPGSQFGGVAAVMAEPMAMECTAVEPSILLKLDHVRGIELARRFPAFRQNFLRLVAQSVKYAILGERQPLPHQLIGFFHESPATRSITAQVFDRLVALGERLHVISDLPHGSPAPGMQFHRIASGDEEKSVAELRQDIPHWRREGQVIGDVAASIDPRLAMAAFEAFTQIYWCVTPDNWQASIPRLTEIMARSPSWRDKVVLIWLLAPDQLAPLAAELRGLVSRDLKIAFGQPAPNQGRALVNGLERLIHLIRGIQIGVALGGGAARGMAHLGVLKALEQQGIVVDMIAGTSAGAMTGTVYASGMDPDFAIERFVHDLRPSRFFRMIPKGDQWYLLYKYRTRHFGPMLRKYLHDACYEQLPIPMHAISLDLISGKGVERDSGDAVQGILESINLPVLSIPINREGQSLVDGGLINNVPADVLTRKGCNLVIAVSVTAKMELEFVQNRPDTPTKQMRPASMVQTLLRSFLVQSFNINAMGIEPADIMIEPDVTKFQLTEFTRTDELAAVGEQATLASIDRIRDHLHRLDPKLFPPSQTDSAARSSF